MTYRLISSVYGAGNFGGCGSYTSGSCTPASSISTNSSTSSTKTNPTSTPNTVTKTSSKTSDVSPRKTTTKTFINSSPKDSNQIYGSNVGLFASIFITLVALILLGYILTSLIKRRNKKLNNNDDMG